MNKKQHKYAEKTFSPSFLIYNSSAGSGKTHSIAKEYIRICLRSPSNMAFASILCLSFTNKAANEMKERIMFFLKKISTKDYNIQFINEFLDGIKISKVVARRKADSILDCIINNYSLMSVFTIDHFMHKIIRSFSVDIGLNSNFEVSVDEDKILEDAVNKVIESVVYNYELKNLLTKFAKAKMNAEKSWRIEKDIYELGKNLLTEEGQVELEKINKIKIEKFIKIEGQVKLFIKNYDYELNKIGKKFNELCKNFNVKFKDFIGGEVGIPKYFKKLSENNYENYIPSERINKLMLTSSWSNKKCDIDEANKIDIIKKSLKEELINLKNLLVKYPKYIKLKNILFNLNNFSILSELSKKLSEIKTNNNILPIYEFNKLINNILQTDSTNYIYEKTGIKFSHYFIDEFQDTSLLQWNNLLPLIENSLSEVHDIRPTALVVGDPKQAIYRWRGGNVEQFLSLFYNLRLKKTFSILEKKLNYNYRSNKELVNFNNNFFSFISNQLGKENYKNIYNKLKTKPIKKKLGFFSLNKVSKELEDSYELTKLKEIVTELMNDNFNYGDICILTRTKKESYIISDFLIDNNIPVISSEGLNISNNIEVKFCINFINFLINPNDYNLRFNIIRFKNLFNKYSNDKISYLCTCKLNEFNIFLNKIFKNYNYHNLIGLKLFPIILNIIKSFKIDINNIYVNSLVNEVIRYLKNNPDNKINFIDFWNDNKEKIKLDLPENHNSVNIMTIHKSKGLQFPVVLIPFTNWTYNVPRREYKWVETNEEELNYLNKILLPINKSFMKSTSELKNIYLNHKEELTLDNINILYVAMTRSSERTYIFARDSKRNNIGKLFLDFVKIYDPKWNDNRSLFEYGLKEKFKSNKTVENIEKSNNFKLNDVKFKRENYGVKNEAEFNNLIHGSNLHKILGLIYDEKDVDDAINKNINSAKEKCFFKDLISKIIHNQKLKKFYDKKLNVKNECKILLKNGSTIIPDKFVIYKNHSILIDFKTGKETKKDIIQIKNYKKTLIEMGYRSINCLIVYIYVNKISILEL